MAGQNTYRKEIEMVEPNRTKICCDSDCYYLVDGTRCQYGKNIDLEEREKCGRCEAFTTTTAERWGICSKGLYIECEDYFSNEDAENEVYEDEEEDEEEDEDYED